MAKYWRAYVTNTEAHGSWIYFSTTTKDFSLAEVITNLLENDFHLKTIHRYCKSISPVTYACAICAYPIATIDTFGYHRRSVIIG